MKNPSFQEKELSDAARSWGGSAVLGVPPMSNCRGFPHERLHQDSEVYIEPMEEFFVTLM
ncbi:hypothetical protein [Dapis sp. BLCC M229]|uniref:hypothetical protein n=1 Tax=Dapis sp. BLCC M229 TaxID=3400188 RepID=UPI003CF7DE2B